MRKSADTPYKLKQRILALKGKLKSEIKEGNRTQERLNDLQNRIEQTYKQLGEMNNELRK